MQYDNSKFKDIRIKRGLRLEDLSSEILNKTGVKISSKSLSRYEVTKNPRPRVNYIKAIADYYSVSIDYFHEEAKSLVDIDLLKNLEISISDNELKASMKIKINDEASLTINIDRNNIDIDKTREKFHKSVDIIADFIKNSRV